MRVNIEGKIVKPNSIFTLYFILMCCLYTHTYIQLMAQFGLLFYVILPVFSNYMKLKKGKDTYTNLIFYLSWFGIFTLLMYVSKYWAYSTYLGSKTMLTIFRIFVMGMAILFYVDTKEKAFSVMEAFILGCAVMGVVALLTSWNALGTEEFGNVIGQHRNQIGAIAAPLTYLCYFLYKRFHLKYGIVFSLYFALLTVCTGSRSSILQLILIFALFILMNKENIARKSKKIAIFILIIILIIAVIQRVPFLYETIWLRINNAISTLLGREILDGSVQGRDSYKSIAFLMFLNRPWLGYGLDGFICFLRDHAYIMGYYLEPVYSHCNYAEIAADLGIVGLIVWYVPIAVFFIYCLRHRSVSAWNAGLISIFISMVALDYSRIPWETHLVMYLFITMMLLLRYGLDKKKSYRLYA